MTSTAVITGASSGIGLEFARQLASMHINLLLVARSTGKMNVLAEELRTTFGIKVFVLPLDLGVAGQSEKVFNYCIDNQLEVDYLINNAGFGELGAFHESDWHRQQQMMELNMTSLAHLTHLFLPGMVSRGKGKILNVASTAAFQPGPGMAVYFATKSFVLLFSEGIAEELSGTGVTVTALCPGATESNFANEAKAADSRLFKGRKLPTSADVAAFGINAMLRGKRVAVHGSLNKFMTFGLRFVPRNMATKVSAMIMKK